MAYHPDHDPLVSPISQPPLPGDDHPVEDEEEIVGFPGGTLREPGDSVTFRQSTSESRKARDTARLKIARSSTAEGERLTIAFAHRPPATSQTGTLIPGEIEAALTYYDPQQALEDACEFVTAALAAVRANARRAEGNGD